MPAMSRTRRVRDRPVLRPPGPAGDAPAGGVAFTGAAGCARLGVQRRLIRQVPGPAALAY
jgi:hypothetical protein